MTSDEKHHKLKNRFYTKYHDSLYKISYEMYYDKDGLNYRAYQELDKKLEEKLFNNLFIDNLSYPLLVSIYENNVLFILKKNDLILQDYLKVFQILDTLGYIYPEFISKLMDYLKDTLYLSNFLKILSVLKGNLEPKIIFYISFTLDCDYQLLANILK